ncbi:hypothetical protein [Streptomyces sp. NPDC046821]|uniref:hypothetical protein n=1 Tax=Streptomyces sp. NPDC046821 TaxID=3154702 RepID=UPI0033E3D4E5
MPGIVQVRTAAATLVLDALHPLREALTETERARAARLPSPLDRDAYIAAHLLVRACAAEAAGVSAASLTYAQHCPDCGSGDHGRPRIPELPGLAVSLSHTAGTVAALAGPERVAVDVQPTIANASGLAAVDRLLGPTQAAAGSDPAETATLRWTRHECRVKWGDVASSWTTGSPDPLKPRPWIIPRSTTPIWEGDRWSLTWVDEATGVCGTAMSTRRLELAWGAAPSGSALGPRSPEPATSDPNFP